MKYTKQAIKEFWGKKTNKYAVQELWKRKKNVALQKLSRSENKFEGYEMDHVDYTIYKVDLIDKVLEKGFEKCDAQLAALEELEVEENKRMYPLGSGWD